MATRQELLVLARQRGIDIEEMERALRALNPRDERGERLGDPAGLVGEVTLEDALRVALHMNPARGGITYWSPQWQLIVDGHGAARAIYYHEREELALLDQLGMDDPDELERTDYLFVEAHAQACWREAGYWSRWAQSEGTPIAPAAFLFAHPGRDEAETALATAILRDAGIAVEEPDVLELERAGRFYRSKGIHRP